MNTIKDHNQPKVIGGEQKVILDPAATRETDELDPQFENATETQDIINLEKPEPGDDPGSETM